MSKELNNEILKIKQLMERKASKDMQPMLSAYKNSLTRIQGEITQLTTKHTVDGVLKISDAQRYSVLQNLEKQIIQQAKELGNIELKSTTTILKDVYSESYYRSMYQLERGMSVGGNFSLLHPEFVERAVNLPLSGEMFSDRIWTNKEKMVKRLRSTLEQTLIDGKDPAKLARGIAKDFGTSAYESTRLVQNEVARCTRQAQDQIYEDSGVVEEVMFDATLDGSTSDICNDLNGKIFKLGEHPQIPDNTHVNCRSDLIPVFSGWSPITKRDNETGESVDYTSFNKYKQSKGIE